MEPLVKPIEGVSAAQNRIFRRAEGRDDVETELKAGERITVRELLYGLMLRSGKKNYHRILLKA